MIVAPSHSRTRKLDLRQLQIAWDAQTRDGRLNQVATELGCSSEEEALAIVAETLGIGFVDLASTTIDLSVLNDFPIKLIHRFEVFPIRREEGALVVATGNPFELNALDAVSAATGLSVTPVLALPDEISKFVLDFSRCISTCKIQYNCPCLASLQNKNP